jgi:dTDP-4-amino-4,6-dideoxygalactose transaminase
MMINDRKRPHNMKKQIPFSRPSIGEEEIRLVVETLVSGWITTGPRCARFEEAFARFTGADHAIALNSATAGLHLALEAADVGPGDKVITTTHTFTATAEVARYLGADPIFVDIDPVDMTIDPVALDAVVASLPVGSVKAILPVHFGGLAADMEPIMATARRIGAVVVADAAHALPTRYRGEDVGAVGDAAVFSFYANKNLTTGEGGMVTCRDAAMAERMRLMRLHGIDKDAWRRERNGGAPWYYEVVAPGYKYNMTDIAAAIGLAQLDKLSAFRARREAIVRLYDELLSPVADLVGLPYRGRADCGTDAFYADHAWHLYVIRVANRNAFVAALADEGISASVHFIPLHRQPYWRDTYRLSPDDFPESERLYQSCLSLPLFPSMTDDEVAYVAEAVVRLARGGGR